MGRSKRATSILASTFFCSIPECGETFTRLCNLRRHTENVHEKEKNGDEWKYRCETESCGKRFRKRKQLYDHRYLIHDEERKKKYPCRKCSATFATAAKLAEHTKKHDGYQCKECDFKATWSKLRKHVAVEHPQKHECDQCGKIFPKPYALKKHRRTHEKEIECPDRECRQKILPWRMAMHVEVEHKTMHSDLLADARQMRRIDSIIALVLQNDEDEPKSQTYECSQCGKSFAKSLNLRLHKRNVHKANENDGAKKKQGRQLRFVCTYGNCRSRFPTETRLEDHSNRHKGTKPYQCSEERCSAKYSSRAALVKHLKRRHMKILKRQEMIEQLAEMCGNEKEDDDDDQKSQGDDMEIVG